MPQLMWAFVAQGFPAGVFDSKVKAEAWISRHRITGVLTAYPLNEGTYDWAVSNGYFVPKNEDQKSPRFMAAFTSFRQQHIHYEDGNAVSGDISN